MCVCILLYIFSSYIRINDYFLLDRCLKIFFPLKLICFFFLLYIVFNFGHLHFL